MLVWLAFAARQNMNNPPRTIGIIGKYDAASLKTTLQSLTAFLQEAGLQVLLDEQSTAHLGNGALPSLEREALGRESDLVVVLGGDGSFLDAARSIAPTDTPLLGINLGRLGFMTDITRGNMLPTMEQILTGEYHEEKRLMLEGEVWRQGECIDSRLALNDVVLTKRDVARMIEFETFAGAHFISNHRADGIVVATPTGSTAYALSGGGPVLNPALDAMVLVPICPHMLSDRPLVVSASSQIEILLTENNTNPAQTTWDGQFSVPLQNGDRVRIRRSQHHLTLVHPRDYNYYAILRDKLQWGRDQTSARD